VRGWGFWRRWLERSVLVEKYVRDGVFRHVRLDGRLVSEGEMVLICVDTRRRSHKGRDVVLKTIVWDVEA
jgi:hypothetical protein